MERKTIQEIGEKLKTLNGCYDAIMKIAEQRNKWIEKTERLMWLLDRFRVRNPDIWSEYMCSEEIEDIFEEELGDV